VVWRRAVLLLAPLVAGACGEAPVPFPLEAPDPEREAIVLEWQSYHEGHDDQLEPACEYRLELGPDHRFRYSARPGAVRDAVAVEVAGSWSRGHPESHFLLVPDAGRAALEPGEFGSSRWPELRWSPGVTVGDPAAPSQGATYFLPVVDPSTGRFRNVFAIQQDPRVRARLEAVARGEARLPR